MPAPEIAVAYVSIVPSLQGFQNQLRRQLVGPAGDAGDDAGRAAGSRMGGALKAGAAAAAVAAGAVLVKGVTDALEQGTITKKMGAQLGATAKEAKRYGALAGKLYAGAIANDFQQGADAIKAIMSAGIAPPHATNRQLQSIATKALDVANTFDQDLGGVTNAVSQMMKTGLAKNAGEAFDVITKGFQGGVNKADDLLDTINEYGTQFRKAGLDGATAMGLMQQAIKGGARDSDLAADAIKEFSIRAVDGSKLSKEGFKALGLSADDMASKFGKGGKSASSALDTTLDRLRKMKDPVEQAAAATALFGTQSEDLGKALFAMDPSKAADGLGKVSGAADRMGKSLRGGASYQLKVFTRTLQQKLVGLMARYVIPSLTKFGKYANDNLVPALRRTAEVSRTVGEAVSKGFRVFLDVAPWLLPVGIAIGGITLAVQANAIAVGIATGVFRIYGLAMAAARLPALAFAAGMRLVNLVMAGNPIILAVTAVLALGAALFVAYKKSETFRKIVQGAWAGIKTAASAAWNGYLKPMISGFITGMKAIGTAASWLWTTVIKPVFSFIWTAAKILATVVTIVVAGPIVAALWLVGQAFMLLWAAFVRPALNGIAALAKWLWKSVILPTFAGIKVGLRAVGTAFKWLYNAGVKPALTWIADKLKWLWRSVINPTLNYIRLAGYLTGRAFKSLYTAYVKPALGWIADRAKWVWNKGVKPAFNALKSGVKAVGAAFNTAKNYIGREWSKLSAIAKKPVAFIVNTVYNKGIVPVWNKVASKFGAPTLSKAKGFAEGGYTGSGGKYTPAGVVHAGEYVIPKRETAQIGLPALNHMRATGQMPGFAKGGLVGDAWGWVKNAASSGWDKVKQGASWLKDTVKASAKAGFNKIVDPLISRISGSSSVYKSMVTKVPKKMASEIFDWSGTADKKLEAAGFIGGKGYKTGLKWAKTQHGKRYQWGGNGNPSWDCSGFTSAIESVIRGQKPHRRWATGAFPPGTPGWQRNKKSPYMVGITNAGVGHTAGTINGVNVESRGGDGVVVGSRARGANHPMFTSRWGFTGKYDNGGWLQPGATVAHNKTGKPEPVLTNSQWDSVSTLAAAGAGGLQPGDRLVLSVDGRRDFEAYVDRRADGRIHTTLTGPAALGRK